MKNNIKYLIIFLIMFFISIEGVKADTVCKYQYSIDMLGSHVYNPPLSGDFEITILSSGKVQGTTIPSGFSSGTRYTLEYPATITDAKCPKYLRFNQNLDSVGEFLGTITLQKVDPGKTYHALYIGPSENVSAADFEAYYLAYNSATAPKITISKTNGVYKAIIKEGTWYDPGTEITINGLNEFTSSFDSKDPSKYPTWINLAVDGTYTISNSRDENAKINYICQDQIMTYYDDEKGDATTACEKLFGTDFLRFLKNNVITVIRLAIPLILIAFTTFDFAKVVFTDDKEGIQKATKRFGKRIVAAILIYLIPAILIWLVEIIGADNIKECAEYLENIEAEENATMGE